MFHRSVALIVVAVLMGSLATAVVGLRLWAVKVRSRKWGADDVFIVVGLILALGLCVCNIIGAAKYHFGNHEIYIDSGDLEGFPVAWLLLGYGKIFYAIQLLHATAMPVIKASLMLFLRRIFGHIVAFRRALWIVGIYVILWWLTTFWMSVFQCWPISSNWGTTPAEFGDCIPDYQTWYAWAALLNVISDVAIMIIPIPFILPLNMPRKQKATTIGLITTAIIVIVAGIGRTVSYFTYDRETLDFSYVFYGFLIWTSIEPCLGVVGCCIPTLGPLKGVIDIESSALYLKLTSTFSRKSLSKTSSNAREADPNAWMELSERKDSQAEHRSVYTTAADSILRKQTSRSALNV